MTGVTVTLDKIGRWYIVCSVAVTGSGADDSFYLDVDGTNVRTLVLRSGTASDKTGGVLVYVHTTTDTNDVAKLQSEGNNTHTIQAAATAIIAVYLGAA